MNNYKIVRSNASSFVKQGNETKECSLFEWFTKPLLLILEYYLNKENYMQKLLRNGRTGDGKIRRSAFG